MRKKITSLEVCFRLHTGLPPDRNQADSGHERSTVSGRRGGQKDKLIRYQIVSCNQVQVVSGVRSPSKGSWSSHCQHLPLPKFLYLLMHDLQMDFTDQTRQFSNRKWAYMFTTVTVSTNSPNSEHSIQEPKQESAQVNPSYRLPCSSNCELMSFSIRLDAVLNAIRCTIIALIPLVLSLNIALESAPEAFQSTPISLGWDRDDPFDFVLGAFAVDGLVAATANQVVANFTADRIVNMTFNYTSSSEKDCILLAWPPQSLCVSDMLHLASFL